MELSTRIEPAQVIKTLTHGSSLAAGGKLKLEVGENELDETVPTGKRWDVWVEIQVVESNA